MTEREIFLRALDMDTPAARAAYLQDMCGGDVTFRRRVEELLKEHFSKDSLLAGPALEEERATIKVEPAPEAAPAQMLGRYKLLENIGEGGFGEVWMADQREPVKRRVALKINNSSPSSPTALSSGGNWPMQKRKKLDRPGERQQFKKVVPEVEMTATKNHPAGSPAPWI